jgi:hypothetical protein
MLACGGLVAYRPRSLLMVIPGGVSGTVEQPAFGDMP